MCKGYLCNNEHSKSQRILMHEECQPILCSGFKICQWNMSELCASHNKLFSSACGFCILANQWAVLSLKQENTGWQRESIAMNNKCPLLFAGGKGEKRGGFFIDEQFWIIWKRLENRESKWEWYRMKCWCFAENTLMTEKRTGMSVCLLINIARYLNPFGKFSPVSEKTKGRKRSSLNMNYSPLFLFFPENMKVRWNRFIKYPQNKTILHEGQMMQHLDYYFITISISSELHVFVPLISDKS